MQHFDSEIHNRILARNNYSSRTFVSINDVEYTEHELFRVRTSHNVFGDAPTVGKAIVGEIDVTLKEPLVEIPSMASIKPNVQIFDEQEESDIRIPKGTFYIDTRDFDEGSKHLILHGYDSMLKAENYYTGSHLEWPEAARPVLDEIAAIIGVELDDRTKVMFPYSETSKIVQFPAQYTMREILGYIASTKCGNFIMSNQDKLLFIGINELPEETNLLVTETGDRIVFGHDRILLR